MEVAAYLCGKATSISCIDITAVPFERVLGARVGKMLQGVSRFYSHVISLSLCGLSVRVVMSLVVSKNRCWRRKGWSFT